MTITMNEAIKRIAAFLAGQGYTLVSPPPIRCRIFATRPGRSFGPLLPYTDYIAVQGLPSATDTALFETMHAATRTYAESQTPLPRALRYRLPNAVTIGVSDSPLSPTLVASVGRSRLRGHMDLGSEDSKFLLDLIQEELHGSGIKQTPGRRGAAGHVGVSPSENVRAMLEDLERRLFG